jgi:hypothetical protein
MRSVRFVFGIALAALLAACTHRADDTPPPVASAEEPVVSGDAPGTGAALAPESKTRGRILGTIVTNDSKVSIVSRGGDLRVVIRKTGGALVADGISIDELRTRDPALHAIVTSAVAFNGRQKAFLDATLDRSAHGGADGAGGPNVPQGRSF